MRILFVSSEAHPLIKTGGLADVSGSLPAALAHQGADVRLLIPGYPSVLEMLTDISEVARFTDLPYVNEARLLLGRMPENGLPVLTIDCPRLYLRAGNPYVDATGRDWEDNQVRFGVLSRVAAELSCGNTPLQDWLPDVVQCNDWQTGLTPAYMHFMAAYQPGLYRAKCVFGIHNMAFQGCFGAEWVEKLKLPPESYQMHGLEYYGQMSFMKAGIYYSDFIVTVSPTYAKEIQTPEFGFGLHGLLNERAENIRGILNGIDLNEWNPSNDPYLPKTYDAEHLTGKTTVKKALCKELGLAQDMSKPLLGVVSRLTHQKGLDLVLSIADALIAKGCQIALLGGGDEALEQGFSMFAQRHPGAVSVNIGYNEKLSHRIMAGADIFLMPSRFEPCGLNQMYGLRYGTPPVVNKTGGLADSITDTNKKSMQDNTATGFVMKAATAYELKVCIDRALRLYRDDTGWSSIQRNGMARDVGWDSSAAEYLQIYQTLIKN